MLYFYNYYTFDADNLTLRQVCKTNVRFTYDATTSLLNAPASALIEAITNKTDGVKAILKIVHQGKELSEKEKYQYIDELYELQLQIEKDLKEESEVYGIQEY